MSPGNKLAKILGIEQQMLEELDRTMAEKVGKTGILERVARENEKIINSTLNALDSKDRSASHVRSVLRKTILTHERQLIDFLEIIEGKTEFEKASGLAQKIAKVNKGFFLKKKYAEEILKKREPKKLLNYLKLKNVSELIAKHDITESFSALRFVETNEWMHKTFEEAYSNFTPADFEERDIEIKVLGPEWREVAQKFVEKKHHNVSHLKEFGVIFINPIQENIPGKFLRDFALLLHYFHEIDFYAKLFRRYAEGEDFADKLKMLLRGDVKEIYEVEAGEWLIVQRYLSKENPNDPRLFIPRVNPESMHWARGERDITLFQTKEAKLDLRIWCNLDWVGGLFQNGGEQLVSFDLEDNAMSLVSFMEGKEQVFNYHQREAMWTKIFSEYVGGEDNMEQWLIKNFDKGIIKF